MSFELRFAHLAAHPPEVPERADEESYLDEAIELNVIDDPGADDSESTELDIGGELEDVLADASGDNEPLELDLGSFVEPEQPGDRNDDETDEELALDPALGLELPEALQPDDGAEGIDDHAIVVDESKLPELEYDDGSEGIAAEPEISLGAGSDEAELAVALAPYRAEKPKAAIEACSALTARGPNVVFASSDLLWFRADESSPLRLGIDGSALSDVTLVGPEHDVALVATSAGQIFRRARFASQAEQLVRFRELQKNVPGARGNLAFSASLDPENARTFVATRDGAVFEILEQGERFERVELDGKALALARESPLAVVARERERRLVSLTGEHAQVVLSGAAFAVAHAEAPLLASAGACVALAEPGRALVLSRDRGQSFRGIAGTVNVTALTGTSELGAPRFYAAIYRETSDRTDVVALDPELGEASIVARIESNDDATSDPLERGEWARVARLVWHAESSALWAVGGFGVLRLVRPSS